MRPKMDGIYVINDTFISISVIVCVVSCIGALNQSESTHIQSVTYLKKSLGEKNGLVKYRVNLVTGENQITNIRSDMHQF